MRVTTCWGEWTSLLHTFFYDLLTTRDKNPLELGLLTLDAEKSPGLISYSWKFPKDAKCPYGTKSCKMPVFHPFDGINYDVL